MKKIMLFGLIAALIGAVVGYKMWTKPHENMQSAAVELTVPALDIYAAFESDETAANATYLDKVLAVSGSVNEVSEEGDIVKIMLYGGEEAMGGVYCELDPLSEHARKEFAVGEKITLKCNCSGFTGIDVQMMRCVEQK